MQRREEASQDPERAFPVIQRADELDLLPPDPGPPVAFRSVLMADPAHFDVAYVINPYMEQHLGAVDPRRARTQWDALRSAYQGLGLAVQAVEAVEGLPDLVFIANQSMPVVYRDGRVVAVRSRMRSAHRRPEVEVVARHHEAAGVPTVGLADPETFFEGMGDARWHPGRRLLLVGHGFRTERRALQQLAPLAQAPVVGLRLVDPAYYHLDVCLCPLTPEAALYVPQAFDADGLALLEALFPVLLPVPPEEAVRLACNGNCPDGRHLVLNAGNPQTEAQVRELGIEVVPVDTSEFLKSGGSVYCMTLMLP